MKLCDRRTDNLWTSLCLSVYRGDTSDILYLTTIAPLLLIFHGSLWFPWGLLCNCVLCICTVQKHTSSQSACRLHSSPSLILTRGQRAADAPSCSTMLWETVEKLWCNIRPHFHFLLFSDFFISALFVHQTCVTLSVWGNSMKLPSQVWWRKLTADYW